MAPTVGRAAGGETASVVTARDEAGECQGTSDSHRGCTVSQVSFSLGTASAIAELPLVVRAPAIRHAVDGEAASMEATRRET